MKKKKLTELTPEQRDRMPSWAQQWIEYGWRTTPLTEQEWEVWESGARRCYEYANIPWPGVVARVSSPIVGAYAAPIAKVIIDGIKTRTVIKDDTWESIKAGVRQSVDSGIWDPLWDSVWASVWEIVGGSVREAVREVVGVSVWDSVEASVGGSVWDRVRGSVWDRVRDSVWDSVGDSVEASVGGSVWASVRASVWDSVWGSIEASIWDSVEASVKDSVEASVEASVRASVWASVWDSGHSHFGGRLWCDWDAFFTFFREVVQHQGAVGVHPQPPRSCRRATRRSTGSGGGGGGGGGGTVSREYKPLDIITSETDVHSLDWQMGALVQEIHDGECCAQDDFCYFYPPIWEMVLQCGWTRVGTYYNPDDSSPRLPVRVLWMPQWAAHDQLGGERQEATM